MDDLSSTTRPADPVRVLWLIKGLGPGGAEQLLVAQAGATDRSRVTPEVAYLLPWKDHRVSALGSLDVPVTCLLGTREFDLRWALRLRHHMLSGRFDVLHVHSPAVAAVARATVATMPPSTRPAIVCTEHNRWPRYRPATRWANRLSCRWDSATIAVSDDVRATMPTSMADRVEVLVHGVDVTGVASKTLSRARMRAELGIGADEVVVGIVANYRTQKAYPDLLTAASLVVGRPGSGPPVRVVAVGQGPLEGAIRAEHTRLGLGDRVLLTGYVPDATEVMAAFDIFTLSSIHEGLPVALMDALVLGLPVVATDVGGIPQAVTHGVEGLLVPPGRPEQLAAGWKALVDDGNLRREMAEAARRRGNAFDIGRAARRLDDLYVSLAGRRRSSSLS